MRTSGTFFPMALPHGASLPHEFRALTFDPAQSAAAAEG